MNNINDYRSGLINPDNLPKIDLHGETRDITRVRVSEFIKDNYKMKNRFFCIIHGVSGGVVKEETIKTLKRNKLVLNYGGVLYNPGCTVVEIDIERPY